MIGATDPLLPVFKFFSVLFIKKKNNVILELLGLKVNFIYDKTPLFVGLNFQFRLT